LQAKEGDLVFDHLIGIGTTAVRLKAWGRRYVGTSLDNYYWFLFALKAASAWEK